MNEFLPYALLQLIKHVVYCQSEGQLEECLEREKLPDDLAEHVIGPGSAKVRRRDDVGAHVVRQDPVKLARAELARVAPCFILAQFTLNLD